MTNRLAFFTLTVFADEGTYFTAAAFVTNTPAATRPPHAHTARKTAFTDLL